jgi:hypothetical protein
VEHGDVQLEFVDMQNQLADMFTKALGRVRFQGPLEKISVAKVTPIKLHKLVSRSVS